MGGREKKGEEWGGGDNVGRGKREGGERRERGCRREEEKGRINHQKGLLDVTKGGKIYLFFRPTVSPMTLADYTKKKREKKRKRSPRKTREGREAGEDRGSWLGSF
jgi:hypothetical protein